MYRDAFEKGSYFSTKCKCACIRITSNMKFKMLSWSAISNLF